MDINDLKQLLKKKTIEYEIREEAGFPRIELMKLYKELKELQFQIIQEQIKAPKGENSRQ